MIELTKMSANRAHKLFKVLFKLSLFTLHSHYNYVDDIYDAWKFAERNNPYVIKKKQAKDDE